MKVLRNLNLIIRPVNDLCNLDCAYCDAKERYSRDTISRVSVKRETLKKLIGDIGTSGLKTVRFTWHGGEPLLLPDDFYEDVFEMQAGLSGVEYPNTFQTNGLLLDEKRILLFKKHGVAIGFSLDGNRHEHNAYRFPDKERFEALMANIRLAKKLGLRFSVIMVAHDKNVREIGKICDFMAELAPPNGFIVSPLFLGQGALAPLTIRPDDFSEFLRTLYDKLELLPGLPCNYVYAVKKGLGGGVPKMCFFSGRCANFVSINGAGDMFSTCHENSRYFLGNIDQASLSELLKKHLEVYSSEIEPQFAGRSIYREMGGDPSLIYFQGKGCTRRLVDGLDPYFRSYTDLIRYAQKKK
ncbi:MAG: uncharacterized protein FD189_2339 [Elusimicrobia bacterium]|nr:MAG: uncharacterized protein FD154_2333 [Elusimicrobiota bacterium]KAF0153701.1 MAG: uncharacterized protein FD189_2339 [Elusimicrobiota bacterium]